MSNQDDHKDRIIDKVKKMLALSKSTNPNEAATALSMAQKLMEKHSLSIVDVEDSAITQGSVQSLFSVSVPKHYEGALAQLINKAFGTGVIFEMSSSHNRNPYAQWTFIGPDDQLTVAVWTFKVLAERLRRARGEFVRTIKAANPRCSRGVLTSEADGFCLGWVAALHQMVHEFAQPDAVRDAITRQIEHQATGKSEAGGKTGSSLAQAAGMAAGSKERLYRPVEDNEEKQARLGHGGEA